jgi:hypothetical protein
MEKFKFRIIWSLFALVTLTGCEPLRGIGKGLESMFRSMPMPFR